jgi:hypothetical protein
MADAAVVEDVKGKPADARPIDVPAGKPAAPATPEKPAEKPAADTPAEKKPAEQAKPETPAADSERKAGEEEKPKPPEKYALKVPDGSRVDPDDLAQLEQMAKTAGWSNDDAQAALEELHTHLDAQASRWLTQTTADRDYGGEHLEQSQRLAKLAIDRLRPQGHARRESFLRFLNRGGAGNHLEVVAFLADLGKAMSEDAPGRGSTSSGEAPKSLAERIYPNNPVARADDLYGGS